jgi:hypothetical protein
MVVISLAAGRIVAPVEGHERPLLETITIRPDAKTTNQIRPCRELNDQRTLIHPRRRSRFGEFLQYRNAKARMSLQRHSAAA